MDKYETLKNNFSKLLQDTYSTNKSAPVGSFPNEMALQRHLGILATLEGCQNSFKIECDKIEEQENSSPDSILEPKITDAEVVAVMD